MFIIDWTQHAVGHGGFHTGRARVDDDIEFNWIFDCGARKTAVFDAFLKTWTNQNKQPIDWLFISHFDTDHVSGLDTLMARAVVRDVMVPYVNERELAFLLLHEIDRGNLDRALLELAADPAAFFLGRGAERVTFFRGQRRDGEATPVGSRPERPDGEDDWTRKISPAPQPLPAPPMHRAKLGQPPRVQLIEGECDIAVVRGDIGLRLKPYRAPISPHVHAGLITELQGLVGKIPWKTTRPGLGDLAFAIGHFARTASGRVALRKVFKGYIGSSNFASLSLLSIPHVVNETDCDWHTFGGSRLPDWGEGPVAWLNTGDAELLASVALKDWEDAFGSDLLRTRVLALPHHGSDKNSDDALQAMCPDAILVAHVNAGSSKHPGLNVAGAAGERLVCVTNQAGSEVRMRFSHPWWEASA